MEILDIVKQRHSTVLFDEKPIENEKIDLLFEALRWASSSGNLQPWKFIYSNKHNPNGNFNLMLSLLDQGNQKWAKFAPLLILSLAQMDSKYGFNRYAFHDTGMATAYLMLQASSLGLHVHPMGGFDIINAKKIFLLPQNMEPVAFISIGYLGNKDQVSVEIQEKEKIRLIRTRKDINEIRFENNL